MEVCGEFFLLSMVGDVDGGSNSAGALCELPSSLWEANHTASAFNFALTLGYIQVPQCRVHPGALMLG